MRVGANTLGLFYNQGRERVKFYTASGFDVQTIRVRTAADVLAGEEAVIVEDEAVEETASAGAGESNCCFVDE